jgi:hypothetical protein
MQVPAYATAGDDVAITLSAPGAATDSATIAADN